MASSKKIDLYRDSAAGVYTSLQTGDTVSHVGIFDPCKLLPISPSLWLVPLPLPVFSFKSRRLLTNAKN